MPTAEVPPVAGFSGTETVLSGRHHGVLELQPSCQSSPLQLSRYAAASLLRLLLLLRRRFGSALTFASTGMLSNRCVQNKKRYCHSVPCHATNQIKDLGTLVAAGHSVMM